MRASGRRSLSGLAVFAAQLTLIPLGWSSPTATPASKFDYRVLATKKTSTMQKELLEAGAAGYGLAGLTVAETAFGGTELVVILRRSLP
jgi:hypothetical protein